MIEAICLGVPIVATDVGGTRELFDENPHIGRLAANDPRKIADAIDEIIDADVLDKHKDKAV